MVLFPLALVWVVVVLVWVIRSRPADPEAPERWTRFRRPDRTGTAGRPGARPGQRFSIESANGGRRFATARLNSASYSSSIPSASVRA